MRCVARRRVGGGGGRRVSPRPGWRIASVVPGPCSRRGHRVPGPSRVSQLGRLAGTMAVTERQSDFYRNECVSMNRVTGRSGK